MFLTRIKILNFRSHLQREIPFSKKINCLIGANGTGKTNLLDAVYYLCLTKSYFGAGDINNISFTKDFFRVEGDFVKRSAKHHLVYKFQSGKKKELSMNDVAVQKFSDFIGEFPAVMIAPDDNQLIIDGSEERRKFLDNTISQVNHEYLDALIQYNKILSQRNAALKQFAETKRTDKTLIATYNNQLLPLATKIFEIRAKVTSALQFLFQDFYKKLSLEREQVSFAYASQLHEKPLDVLLEENFQRDCIMQRTEAGIHKDDIEFFIGDKKLKRFSSQGQQKSFVVALKLAQYMFIRNLLNETPLLLIDDIFDKLDSERSRQLVEIISGKDFEQVFVTDTDEQHITAALEGREIFYDIIRF